MPIELQRENLVVRVCFCLAVASRFDIPFVIDSSSLLLKIIANPIVQATDFAVFDLANENYKSNATRKPENQGPGAIDEIS